MNRDVEQQVWQRVLGQSEPPRGSLRPMELEAMEAAAVYRKLAGQFSGRGREQLRHLHDMQMEILACLRGIGRLSGSGGRKTAQIAVPEEPAAKALEKRYHCARRAVTEYTVRTVDGDFGIVFQHLADLSRGGVRSAGPSAGGTGAEHFTIIGKKTKPGHDPPQGSHVPVFSILNVPDLCQVADMHARRDRKFRGIARFICPERRICSAQHRFRRFSAPSGTLPWRESCRAR